MKWSEENTIVVRTDNMETIYKIETSCDTQKKKLTECYKLFGLQLSQDTATFYGVKDNKLPEDGIVIPYGDNRANRYKRAYITDSDYTAHQDDEGNFKAIKKVRQTFQGGGINSYGDEHKKIITTPNHYGTVDIKVTTKLPVLRSIAVHILGGCTVICNKEIVSFEPLSSKEITGEGSDGDGSDDQDDE